MKRDEMSGSGDGCATNGTAPGMRQVPESGVLVLTAPVSDSLDDRTEEGQVCTDPCRVLSPPAALMVASAAAVCVLAAIAHVAMVFLYVAPPNTISTQYRRAINAWISPYFEQNWQLFAPNPQSARQQIWARMSYATAGVGQHTSDWIDLSAVDDEAVHHDPFPSHTSQNMLRRAWDAYVGSHGESDQASSQQARMFQEYLLNIAAQRLSARGGRAFDAVQLRVVTTPIEPPASQADDSATSASSDIRYLPWWPVTSHGN
jgi:hypothetical protein